MQKITLDSYSNYFSQQHSFICNLMQHVTDRGLAAHFAITAGLHCVVCVVTGDQIGEVGGKCLIQQTK